MSLKTSLTNCTYTILAWLATASATSAFFPHVVTSNDNFSPRPLQRNAALNDHEFLFPKNSKETKDLAFIKTTIAEMTPTKLHQSAPATMYHNAWSAIDSNFIDQAFNHQHWTRWKKKYSNSIYTNEDALKAIESAVTTLGDRYTFCAKHVADKFIGSEELSTVCGVGIQLGVKTGHRVFVVETIDGSSAEKAGVKKNWILTNVDGTPTARRTLEQIANQIRGVAGTSVELSFLEGTKERTLKLGRSPIAVPTIIKTFVLPQGIGYIRINSLRETTASEVRRELCKMETTTNGLILDLRDCDGMAFHEALKIADMFSQKVECISQVKLIQKKKLVTRGIYSSGQPLFTKPLAVLANRGTSGSPEIVVAALRDGGATTYGTNTDGNATVQVQIEVTSSESLYITAGIAVSPKRSERFYLRGLVPDARVAPFIYYRGCTDDTLVAANAPWYLFPYNDAVNGTGIASLGAQQPAIGEQVFQSDEHNLLADCQLATAYQGLKSRLHRGQTCKPVEQEKPVQ